MTVPKDTVLPRPMLKLTLYPSPFIFELIFAPNEANNAGGQ
jgi:hypothetical protein